MIIGDPAEAFVGLLLWLAIRLYKRRTGLDAPDWVYACIMFGSAYIIYGML